jgi:hypothetical protein
MTLVDEGSADDTGAAVHVLVVTPCCEVDVPVVQFQWHVSYSVC